MTNLMEHNAPWDGQGQFGRFNKKVGPLVGERSADRARPSAAGRKRTCAVAQDGWLVPRRAPREGVAGEAERHRSGLAREIDASEALPLPGLLLLESFKTIASCRRRKFDEIVRPSS
jgi:hypothetical protein